MIQIRYLKSRTLCRQVRKGKTVQKSTQVQKRALRSYLSSSDITEKYTELVAVKIELANIQKQCIIFEKRDRELKLVHMEELFEMQKTLSVAQIRNETMSPNK